MTLKLFLKNSKKPICFEIEKYDLVEQMYNDLMTRDIVKFGPVIFRREDFIYCVAE